MQNLVTWPGHVTKMTGKVWSKAICLMIQDFWLNISFPIWFFLLITLLLYKNGLFGYKNEEINWFLNREIPNNRELHNPKCPNMIMNTHLSPLEFYVCTTFCNMNQSIIEIQLLSKNFEYVYIIKNLKPVDFQQSLSGPHYICKISHVTWTCDQNGREREIVALWTQTGVP